MKWHPDIPDLPIEKPKQIEQLEQMDRVSLDSMPPMEVQEKVEEIAHAVASAYKEQVKHGSFDTCVEIVSTALTMTGSSIGGHVGDALIANSDKASHHACSIAFPGSS